MFARSALVANAKRSFSTSSAAQVKVAVLGAAGELFPSSFPLLAPFSLHFLLKL